MARLKNWTTGGTAWGRRGGAHGDGRGTKWARVDAGKTRARGAPGRDAAGAGGLAGESERWIRGARAGVLAAARAGGDAGAGVAYCGAESESWLGYGARHSGVGVDQRPNRLQRRGGAGRGWAEVDVRRVGDSVCGERRPSRQAWIIASSRAMMRRTCRLMRAARMLTTCGGSADAASPSGPLGPIGGCCGVGCGVIREEYSDLTIVVQGLLSVNVRLFP